MSRPDKNESLDAWGLYCRVFHAMFGEDSKLELSPAALLEFKYQLLLGYAPPSTVGAIDGIVTKMHILCTEIDKFPDFDDLGIEQVKVRSAHLRDIEEKARDVFNALLAEWKARKTAAPSARKDILEEAAQVCDALGKQTSDAALIACRLCADGIRKLASTDGGTANG